MKQPDEIPGGSEPGRARVRVDRHGDRILVTIERRQARVFSLSLEESADLIESLREELARPGQNDRHEDGRDEDPQAG